MGDPDATLVGPKNVFLNTSTGWFFSNTMSYSMNCLFGNSFDNIFLTKMVSVLLLARTSPQGPSAGPIVEGFVYSTIYFEPFLQT